METANSPRKPEKPIHQISVKQPKTIHENQRQRTSRQWSIGRKLQTKPERKIYLRAKKHQIQQRLFNVAYRVGSRLRELNLGIDDRTQRHGEQHHRQWDEYLFCGHMCLGKLQTVASLAA